MHILYPSKILFPLGHIGPENNNSCHHYCFVGDALHDIIAPKGVSTFQDRPITIHIIADQVLFPSLISLVLIYINISIINKCTTRYGIYNLVQFINSR
jgi:hypothetical protein